MRGRMAVGVEITPVAYQVDKPPDERAEEAAAAEGQALTVRQLYPLQWKQMCVK